MLALIATAVHAQASSSVLYNKLYDVIAVIMLIGFAYAAYKWIKGRGVTEAAVQKMLDLRDSLQKLVDANVLDRLSHQDEVLADIQRAIRPNGLDTNELGDMLKRTENAVDRIEKKLDVQTGKLAAHMGASEVEEREIWRAIKDLRAGKADK